jgi:hypothetical protein
VNNENRNLVNVPPRELGEELAHVHASLSPETSFTTRVAAKQIEHKIEPEQRKSERYVVMQWGARALSRVASVERQ